ncbi:hypothetical protein [Zavarzinia sp.]|uniref:hypothetical protein n=1 Tax=Zavarzinia sp. TaxID=2027920 RepID=UPI003BB489E3
MDETVDNAMLDLARARIEKAFELWGRDIAANPGDFLCHEEADQMSVEIRARKDAEALLRYLQLVDEAEDGGDKLQTAASLHNQQAREIVARMIRTAVDHGGTTADILVLAESVLTGIVIFAMRDNPAGSELLLLAIANGARARLAEIRAGGMEK